MDNYRDARRTWARQKAASFLDDVKKIADEMEITVKPIQWVKVYQDCIEDHNLEYPAEFDATEIIARGNDDFLDEMKSLLKKYRLNFLEFCRERKEKN